MRALSWGMGAVGCGWELRGGGPTDWWGGGRGAMGVGAEGRGPWAGGRGVGAVWWGVGVPQAGGDAGLVDPDPMGLHVF